MNPRAIFSKTGKGVQEASGKTSHLSRSDRNVLKEIDGKTTVGDVAKKFEKLGEEKLGQLIQQLDKDGYIREISSGEAQPAARAAPPRAAPPRAAPPPASGGDDDMDFTAMPAPKAPPPPKAPAIDLAAGARAEADRKAKEGEAFDYKARAEAEAKAKAQAEAEAKAKARAAAEARVRQEAEANAKAAAEAEAKARAEAAARAQGEAATAAAAKAQAEADAKVKAAREAAVRMATEAKAKTEAAEERARRESEDKARLEAELKAKLEEEHKAREAAEQARKDLEEKLKREAEEIRQRLEAEMRAKLDEERRAREEEDRKRREEEDRRRKEEDERRAKEEAERRAREEQERKRRDEEERKRREEEDRKRREEDERRRKEEDERRAKEEAERRAREEEDRKRREEEERKRKEEDERRAKEEADRKRKEEEDRKRREDEDRRRREDVERKEREEAEARARAAQAATPPPAAAPPPPPPAAAAPPPPPPPAAPAAAAGGSFGDSLLADLDSFTQRDEEERKAKEEAERKAKEEAERKAKEEAERKAKEEAEQQRREDEERRRKEEEARRAQEEAERRAIEEEERRKSEEAERKRKAKESLAAKQAEQRSAEAGGDKPAAKAAPKAAAVGDDDIGVTEDDLDMDDVKHDEKKLGVEARKAARERERAESRRGKDEPVAAVAAAPRKPVKWGKPAAIALFVALVGGVGVLHVMPISTAEYEKAASEAFGAPVKIGSARLSVITGVEVRFEGVSVGDSVKIRQVRGFPEIGSLFGAKKAFSRVELEGLSLSQEQLGEALLGKASGENLRIGRIEIKQAKLDGPLTLPPLDVTAVVAGDGSMQSIALRGGDKLSVQLSPKGSEIGFEISAGSLALPFVPALTLSDFGMKGTATRQGVTASEFDGRAFEGVISGTARIRWGANWSAEGELRARGIRVGVFAPALVSEGKVEGRGTYTMSGTAPAKLFEGARLDGTFKIENGVLGSFDLTRALQTGGAQSGGRTMFSELTGQGLYDKGAMQFRNVAVVSGASMNAGASLDIDAGGALSGRIAADVKTPTQTLRATLNISGKIQEPVIRK